jgi:hypothetical protein
MNTLKTIIAALVSATVGSAALAGNGGSHPTPGGSVSNPQNPQTCAAASNISTPLSAALTSSLRFMREEEKLARDVYLYLNTRWNSRIFANIAAAEQTHTDQILCFLQAYNLPDSASATVGVFNDASLQQLYNLLTAEGSKSLLDAFQVGALIEEVDIRDLRSAIAASSDRATNQTYLNLMIGSYSHLKAFVGQIESLGIRYSAQILDASDVSAILAGNGATTVNPVAGGAFSINTGSVNGPMTGLWSHPSEPGWGGTITQQYGKIFAAFYTYESNGAPVWYTVSDCPVSGGSCSGALYKVTGGVPLSSAWSGANIALMPVGTVSLSFADANNGTLDFTVNGVSGSKQIARYIFASPIPSVAADTVRSAD